MGDTAQDLLRFLENEARKGDDRAYGFEGQTVGDIVDNSRKLERARRGPPAPVGGVPATAGQGMLPIREQIGDEFSRLMNPKASLAAGEEKARGFMQDRMAEDALLNWLLGGAKPAAPANYYPYTWSDAKEMQDRRFFGDEGYDFLKSRGPLIPPAANPLQQHINGMLPPRRELPTRAPTAPMIGVRG